jgi:hypothetical protein
MRWKSCFDSHWLLLASSLLVSAVAGARQTSDEAADEYAEAETEQPVETGDAGAGDAAPLDDEGTAEETNTITGSSPAAVLEAFLSTSSGVAPSAPVAPGIDLDDPNASNPAWVLAKPSIADQVEKKDAARGGVDPCMPPDPGYGGFQHWRPLAGAGWILLPKASSVDANGGFNVLFHFHGHEAARKEWVPAMKRSVLVAFDLGIRSDSYADSFEAPNEFARVVRKVEREVAEAYGLSSAHAGTIGISTWSAGYGAASRILSQSFGRERVRDLIVLDGIHTGYSGQNLEGARLEPFVDFARRAVEGDAFLFVSHSSVTPRGFASSTETANYLVWKTGGEIETAKPRATDPVGLELLSTYNKGDFHVRGFRGGGTKDHCAQLSLLGDVLRAHIKPRWEPASGMVAQNTPSSAGEPSAPASAAPATAP